MPSIAATVGHAPYILASATCGGDAVHRRHLAVEHRNIALHNGFAFQESTSHRSRPENQSVAIFGATKLKNGLTHVVCGARICAAFVAEPAGGLPRCSPSVPSVRASSVRTNSFIPRPVTERARPGHQPAVCQRVVGRLAQQPSRGRGRQALLHQPVIHQVRAAGPVEVRQPCPVPHGVADGDLRLAVGAELRPVLGNGGLVVDQAAIGQPVDDRRGHALRRREHHGAGVGRPAHLAAPV